MSCDTQGGWQRVIRLESTSRNTTWPCLRDCVQRQCLRCVASVSENGCPCCLPELLQTQFTRSWRDRELIYRVFPQCVLLLLTAL